MCDKIAPAGAPIRPFGPVGKKENKWTIRGPSSPSLNPTTILTQGGIDQSPDPMDSLTILFDTSASRAVGFRGQVMRLREVISVLINKSKKNFDLTVACFDQNVEKVFKGKANQFDAEAAGKIVERRALGASDLEGAINWLAMNTKSSRVLIFTDGITTAGRKESGDLASAVFALKDKGVRRLDALVDGGIRDEEMLLAIVDAGLKNTGVVVDARAELAIIANKLTKATVADTRIDVKGSTWMWPYRVSGLQDGDEVLVFAQIPVDQEIEVTLSGPQTITHKIKPIEVPRPLIERAGVRAQIDKLTFDLGNIGDPKSRPKLKQEIIDMSIKYRVISDLTALLVLETEEDYERFNIDRLALSDILTVGPAGIELMKRAYEEKAKLKIAQNKQDVPKDEARKIATDGELETRSMAKEASTLMDEKSGEWEEAEGGAMEIESVIEPEPNAAPPSPIQQPAPADAEEPQELMARSSMRAGEDSPMRRSRRGRGSSRDVDADDGNSDRQRPEKDNAYEGRFGKLMDSIDRGLAKRALKDAWKWRDEDPGDVLALIIIGEAAENRGDIALAMRAYGSIIDLFPSRADMRRMAGERLERLGEEALALVLDTYKVAVEQRPDHPSSHRLYAFALIKAGRPKDAFMALATGLDKEYPGGRFAGVNEMLIEDLGLIAAAWVKASPRDKPEAIKELKKRGATLATTRSTRFVLNWESDANDVDLHIFDKRGNHASYNNHDLKTGGSLIADVTTGYGPEAFVINGKARAFPYTLQAHYYSRGPMGYGMGKLQIITHDGRGRLTFEEQPFVVMKDGAYITLAVVKRPRN